MLRMVWFAALLGAVIGWVPPARAAGGCPGLPEGSGLRWEAREVPGMVFCKGIREADGQDLLSVSISEDSPFRRERELAQERGTIEGRKVRWYKGSDGFNTGLALRETALELDDGRVAHVVVRAPSEEAVPPLLEMAAGLRFASP